MKLSDHSTEKLRKEQTLLKTVLVVLPALGSLAAALLFILKAKPTLYLPVLTLPMTFIPMIVKLKAVNAELKSRAVDEL